MKKLERRDRMDLKKLSYKCRDKIADNFIIFHEIFENKDLSNESKLNLMKMLKNGIIVELEEMEDYIIEEMNK
jgi:hypothetical protein